MAKIKEEVKQETEKSLKILILEERNQEDKMMLQDIKVKRAEALQD
ncbi:MAG: hypothetical protein E6789_09335 [Clostridium baratii]|nr:hypothetical protein [Clostridium baratii]